MKLDLRVSHFDDYVAVDQVDEKGFILRTVVYMAKGKPVKVKVYDFEDYHWYDATLTYLGGLQFRCLCADGVEWNDDVKELLDTKQYKYLDGFEL